jgi:hypothetical protein
MTTLARKSTKTMVAAILSTLTLAGGAVSAAPGAPKEVKDLDCLGGAWKGRGTFQAGDTRANIDVDWRCERTSAEWGLSCRLVMLGVPGVERYEESDLFGFDPGAGRYHWFSVTNAGETHDHVAAVPKGNVVEWTYAGVQDGKAFKEVVKMTFTEKTKAMKITAETFLDGKSTSVISGTLRK